MDVPRSLAAPPPLPPAAAAAAGETGTDAAAVASLRGADEGRTVSLAVEPCRLVSLTVAASGAAWHLVWFADDGTAAVELHVDGRAACARALRLDRSAVTSLCAAAQAGNDVRLAYAPLAHRFETSGFEAAASGGGSAGPGFEVCHGAGLTQECAVRLRPDVLRPLRVWGRVRGETAAAPRSTSSGVKAYATFWRGRVRVDVEGVEDDDV